MKLLTLLQTDTLQATTESGSDFWYGIGFIAFIILVIWSYFSMKRDHAKAEEKRRHDKYMAEMDRIAKMNRLKDKKIPYFKIKGVTSYDLKKPGCYICKILAEPENPYDPCAVKIEHPTLGTIGHLPKGNFYIHELALKKELTAAVEMGYYRGTPFGKLYIDPAIFTDEDVINMEKVIITE